MRILERKKVFVFLKKRRLISQYTKAKVYLQKGSLDKVGFKKREPNSSGVWYFRINKQYRSFGYFEDDEVFVVFSIDDHQ